MNKLIAKTAIITISVLLALSVTCITLAALFSPNKFAVTATKLGMYRTGATFQQIAYNRRPTIENLGTLIDYAVAGNRDGLLVRYCPKMMNASDYAEYCAYRDGTAENGLITGAYNQYVCGSYAVALYRTKKKQEALTTVRLTVKNEYPANNAVQYLLYEVLENKDEETALSISEYLGGLYAYLVQESPQTPSSQMADIAKDQCLIYGFLLEEEPNNQTYNEQMQFWSHRI